MFSFGWWGTSRVIGERDLDWGSMRFVELIRFMRPETSTFIAGMAATGYLLFNSLGPGLFFVFFTVYFLSAFGYALNYLEDKREDLLNEERLNVYVTNGLGPLVAAFFLGISFIFSFQLF